MSLLHPNEDDNAFAYGHALEGLRAMRLRVNELRALLRRVAACLPATVADSPVAIDVAAELAKKDEYV